MIIHPIKTKVFTENENLITFINHYVKRLKDKSVVVVTSKIVALAEGRTAIIETVETKHNLIRQESEVVIPTRHVWLTVKDGMVMASAGIDESNANGKLIMLPKDSYKIAAKLRQQLMARHHLKHLGVLITDSRTMPLRSGITGVSLGYAGFRGIKDYRGTRDIFGRTLEITQANIPDALSALAVMLMGEGNERVPMVVARNVPGVRFTARNYYRNFVIAPKTDLYAPLLKVFQKKK